MKTLKGLVVIILLLEASWTANIESDVKEYRLYRTDEGRVLLGVIPHPTTVYNFQLAVADNSEATLTFVLTAVNQTGEESLDSETISFVKSVIKPNSPQNLRLQSP